MENKAQTPDSNNILYVNASATGTGTGTTWANALTQLADALKYARTDSSWTTSSPLKIYVAKGTYKPLYNAASNALTSATDRDNAFVMVNNVQIYGGFDPDNGIDDLTDTRDYTNTILSGDIATTTDDAYHVVISVGEVGAALLDGFTVTSAYSTSSSGTITVNSQTISRYYGGGMYNCTSSPTITNCNFNGNKAATSGGGMYNYESTPTISDCNFTGNSASYGGGVLNYYSSPTITNCNFNGNTTSYGGGMYNNASSPTITNCSFTGNTATTVGGGMYNSSSSSKPTITNCSFTGNTASYYGGGMCNWYSASPTIANCDFTENTATSSGGGMYNNSSSPTITNCSFTGNTATTYYGGGIYNATSSSPTITNTTIANNGSTGFYNSSSTPVLQNSIVWDAVTGSYTATYSLIKGTNPSGTGNINATSLAATAVFTDTANGDYTLKSSSPAINTGSNALNTTTTDLAGNTRGIGGTIDMGAYEYQSALPVTLVNFTATKKGDAALLQWATAMETNNLGFDVERSADGKVFSKIGFVAGAGTTSIPQQYLYTDQLPLSGVNYYRLKQIDVDGGYAYSTVQTVSFPTARGVKVYPNPVAKELNITLAGAKGLLTITGASGKTVKTVTATGAGTLQIDISALSPGVYFFRIDGHTGSFIKQ
ncbi:MAG: right-handed parallel beta-helix repeat-containing protein [Edaphocola sp.]